MAISSITVTKKKEKTVSINNIMGKLRYVHVMKCYSATKRNTLLFHMKTRTNIKSICCVKNTREETI